MSTVLTTCVPGLRRAREPCLADALNLCKVSTFSIPTGKRGLYPSRLVGRLRAVAAGAEFACPDPCVYHRVYRPVDRCQPARAGEKPERGNRDTWLHSVK